MKKKGFTLIELLAIIVILAILALIVSPIISGVIKKTKISSATRSMEGFVDSINTASMLYSTDNEGAIASSYVDIETLVEAKNKSQIKNPKVTLNDNGIVKKVTAQIDNYYCMYKEGKETICSEEEIDDTLKPGTEVYFNPVSGQKCNDYTIDNSASGEKGNKCMLFYVIKDNEDTVDLILDHNTSSGIKWYTSKDNSKGPVTALAQLKADTQGWIGVTTRTDSYTLTQNVNGVSKNYTINYSDSRARFIIAQELADITGATGKNGWNETTSVQDDWYYLDSLNHTKTVGSNYAKKISDYAWLFNNLGEGDYRCQTYGCTMDKGKTSGDSAYWTATASVDSSRNAWIVVYNGSVSGIGTANETRGIRPVITISSDVLD